jgi:hypothetical protein
VRRRLVVCTAGVAVLVAFAVARKHPPVAHAATSPDNLQRGGAPAYPGCALGPALTFCDQASGTGSTQGVFGVINDVPVTNVSLSVAAIPGLVANFAAGDFMITANTCTGNLAANQGCAFSALFTPTTTGLRQAALMVTDSAGDKATFNVEGTGTNLFVAPPVQSGCAWDNAFTYCTQTLGTASATETFPIMAGAAGASGINVTFVATPGLSGEFDSADFTIVANTCGALAAFQSCTVGVEFTPRTAGLRAATLTAIDSAGDATQVYLAGRTNSSIASTFAVGAFPPCPEGSFVQYCNQPIGGSSPAITYRFQNTSGSQLTGLTIPSASPNTDFKVSSTSCAATLPANATCDLSIEFTPQKAGLRQDSITLTDAQGDSMAMDLAGVGDDYGLQLPSTQNMEISVVAGGAAAFNAQVIPDSVFGINGEQVMFVCPPNLPVNTSCAITPCPASITAGTATNFQIVFTTSSATKVAPVPTGGCSGYGPQLTAASPAPAEPRHSVPRNPRAGVRFLALLFGVMGALTFLAIAADWLCGKSSLRAGWRWAVFACAGTIAVAFLAGCGSQGGTKSTSATPAATSTLKIQGNALDASGNPLNTGRSLNVILNVTAQ